MCVCDVTFITFCTWKYGIDCTLDGRMIIDCSDYGTLYYDGSFKRQHKMRYNIIYLGDIHNSISVICVFEVWKKIDS